MNERLVLTVEQAKNLLVQGKTIHAFANPNGMLVGADWELEEVIKYIDDAIEIELAGAMAKNLNHALAVLGEQGRYFFETDRIKVEYLEKCNNQ